MKFSILHIDADLFIMKALLTGYRKEFNCMDAVGIEWVCNTRTEVNELKKREDFLFITESETIPTIDDSKRVFKQRIKTVKKDLKCPTAIMYLSNEDKKINHRYKAAKRQPYKHNRKDKPANFSELRQYVVDSFEYVVSDVGEADDTMAMAQTEDSLIVTTDKDLLQVPGYVYNPDTKTMTLVSDPGTLTLETYNSGGKKLIGTGFKWFCAQVLLGDPVDGYSGLKGWGPVKVYKYLDGATNQLEMWSMVKEAYDSSGESYEYLKEQAVLAWIIRSPDALLPAIGSRTLL